MQRLGLKFYMQASSAYYLSFGTAMLHADDPAGIGVARDHMSVAVIVRSCLETLCTLHHVYMEPEGAEAEYREIAWTLSYRAIFHRMRHWAKDEGLEIEEASHAKREAELEELANRLPHNEVFAELTSKQKKSVMRGNWNPISPSRTCYQLSG